VGCAARVREINGWSWSTYPSVDDTEPVLLAIASGGWDEDLVTAWLNVHLALDEQL
jgi:hypothetical protein